MFSTGFVDKTVDTMGPMDVFSAYLLLDGQFGQILIDRLYLLKTIVYKTPVLLLLHRDAGHTFATLPCA